VDRAPDDGTRERRLEEALRESEERFRRLVEAAKDYAIFMTDAEGRMTTWNEGAARLFGYEEGEILGRDGSVLFVPEDRESGAPERELGKARTEGRAEDERWHLRKDGTRFWASGFVRPILDEEGDLLGFSKVARDLTERKRAEEAVDVATLGPRKTLRARGPGPPGPRRAFGLPRGGPGRRAWLRRASAPPRA
jgi:PAS domain S-box-containing protein